jgi:hypothetical protein
LVEVTHNAEGVSAGGGILLSIAGLKLSGSGEF